MGAKVIRALPPPRTQLAYQYVQAAAERQHRERRRSRAAAPRGGRSAGVRPSGPAPATLASAAVLLSFFFFLPSFSFARAICFAQLSIVSEPLDLLACQWAGWLGLGRLGVHRWRGHRRRRSSMRPLLLAAALATTAAPGALCFRGWPCPHPAPPWAGMSNRTSGGELSLFSARNAFTVGERASESTE
eukprot:COSAG04_NODE_11026_length_736_cov_0.668760_1_plen_187_part_01